MSDSNHYRAALKVALAKLQKAKPLKSETEPLSDSDNKKLLINTVIRRKVAQALKLLDTDFDRAAEILCDLPYRMVRPNPKAMNNKPRYVASGAVYSLCDSVRHYIRMIALDTEGAASMRTKAKTGWNNILVIG